MKLVQLERVGATKTRQRIVEVVFVVVVAQRRDEGSGRRRRRHVGGHRCDDLRTNLVQRECRGHLVPVV